MSGDVSNEAREVQDLTAEEARVLWLQVIKKAVEDLQGGPGVRAGEAREAYLDARDWLFSDSSAFPAFLAVCEMLDLDSDGIRRSLRGHQLSSRRPESGSGTNVLEFRPSIEGLPGVSQSRRTLAGDKAATG